MTKTEFYKELKNIGVDITDKTQMKIWSLALLAMGRDYIDHRLDRCQGCYYEETGMNGERKFSIEKCSNGLCPVKELPDTPDKVVDYLFACNIPLNMQAFYNKYVEPILDELIKHEEKKEGKNNAG